MQIFVKYQKMQRMRPQHPSQHWKLSYLFQFIGPCKVASNSAKLFETVALKWSVLLQSRQLLY